jgi:hypothetical protein
MESARYMESVKYIDNRYSDEINRSCYRFEKLEFKNALLDIDATYVLHLENNGRIDSVKKQLNEFQPTKNVFILYNKGYKKCNKEGYIDTPQLDIVDAYLYIFKDVQKKNYKNILVLEDDFIFNDKIKNKTIQKNIMNFINNKNYDIYSLGMVPFLQKAYNNTTSICIIGGGAHSFIYSRECINKILQEDKRKIEDWDMYLQNNFRRYIYIEPLCYQLQTETENQKYWDPRYRAISLYIIKLLKLDVQGEPGYSTMYIVSRGLYGLCVILVVWLFITVFNI